MLMLGFLADVQVNEAIGTTCRIDGQLLSLGGSVFQFVNQLKGVLFTLGFSAAGTLIILKITSLFGSLRVSEEDETLGLDLSQHGESAYNE
jgi:Amt family ammonium transporter